MRPNPQETADLVTVIEEILDGKPLFCAVKTAKGTFFPGLKFRGLKLIVTRMENMGWMEWIGC